MICVLNLLRRDNACPISSQKQFNYVIYKDSLLIIQVTLDTYNPTELSILIKMIWMQKYYILNTKRG